MDSFHSQVGAPVQKLAERYTDYSGTAHEQPLYYPYEPPPPAQGHVTKHHYGSGSSHKSNAAMSALTLLAFLFFLHILQQCLKDHMTAMSTPQVMIMSASKEGDENIAKAHIKFDKTGGLDTDKGNKRYTIEKHTPEAPNNDNYLKITTSEDANWSKSQKYRNPFKKNSPVSDYDNSADFY